VSKPSPVALGLRLVRGVAAASLAAAVQCGDPRMVLADAPRPVLMVSSSLLTAAATQEKAPGLDALIAEAQAAYEAKRDSDFVRLKKLANDDVDFKKSKKVAESEKGLVEVQQRAVEREIKDKRTSDEKKRILQLETATLRNARKAKTQDLTRAEQAIKKVASDVASTRSEMTKDAEKLKLKIQNLKADDLKRIKAENLRAAQIAESIYKDEVRAVADKERRLNEARERTRSIQDSILEEVAIDKKLLSKIEQLEREIASVRKSEQAVVSRVESKTLSAQGAIAQLQTAEADVKTEKAKLIGVTSTFRKAQSLVKN